jgi:hypothetical protein
MDVVVKEETGKICVCVCIYIYRERERERERKLVVRFKQSASFHDQASYICSCALDRCFAIIQTVHDIALT